MTRPLVLLGVSRSGTTLLRVVLDRSPGIAIPDESFFVPLLARRHSATIDAARFLDDVARIPTIRAWGLRVDDVQLRVRSGMATGDAIAAIFEAYADRHGKPRWGDKTPMYMGAAIGLQLLFGIALFPAALLTGVAAFAILALQAKGFRRLESVVAGLILVIVASFAVQVVLSDPDRTGILHGLFVPRFDGTESVLLAAGILGATVMPHVIYLHSALTQHRIVGVDDEARQRIFHFERVDVIIAMGIAGLINLSMDPTDPEADSGRAQAVGERDERRLADARDHDSVHLGPLDELLEERLVRRRLDNRLVEVALELVAALDPEHGPLSSRVDGLEHRRKADGG